MELEKEKLHIIINIEDEENNYFSRYNDYKTKTRESINLCIKNNEYKKAFIKLIDVLSTVEKKDVYEIIDYYSQLNPHIRNRLQSPVSSPMSNCSENSLFSDEV